MLNILKADGRERSLSIGRLKTYNRLTNSSILCITAKDKSTIRQMVVKALFFQIEFGTNAGFCNFSCLPTQKMNAGTRARLRLSSTALADRRMYTMSDVIILSHISVNLFGRICGRLTPERMRI